ncbi:MAG: FAD-binding protein [Evtepia gabavorous]
MRGWTAFSSNWRGGLNRLERAEGTAIYVGSGVTLAQAAVFAAHHGLTGLEFAHGIPGTMGGGVFMNAGAYEGEMSQVVDWVDCLDEEGMPRRLSREALALGYRSSIFLRRPWLITGAHLTLAPGDPCGHPGENGRPVPPPPGQAAPGVSQRGKHL